MQLEELYRSRIFQVILGLACLLAIYIYYPGEEREGLVIHGTVTLDGNMLLDGMINFMPVDKSTGKAAGGLIKEGKYDTKNKLGIKPGKYRVEIYAYKGDDQIPGNIPESDIPASWNTASEHVITVTEDYLKHDFDILSEK